MLSVMIGVIVNSATQLLAQLPAGSSLET